MHRSARRAHEGSPAARPPLAEQVTACLAKRNIPRNLRKVRDRLLGGGKRAEVLRGPAPRRAVKPAPWGASRRPGGLSRWLHDRDAACASLGAADILTLVESILNDI